MKVLSSWLRKQIAACLILLMAIPLAEAESALPQEALSGQQTQSVSSTQNQPKDSETNLAAATLPDSPAPARGQNSDQSGQSSSSQPNAEQQQSGDNKPVGTAAAPLEKSSGVAASRPAGAVIAPAKQRRARAIFIRVGIVVGAAVAIGTVVALSRSSPSKPN
jgi:hypothetical protein